MKIEQVLHGYSNGHTILNSSLKTLSSNDLSKMDVLSDWSGYVDERDDGSYITAYLLDDSCYYVVAKSWYADDMERPGCVWTHSLLVDLNDIDKNFDFRIFLTYFKRPVKNDYEAYGIALDIDTFPSIRKQRTFLPIDEASILFLYSSLFVQDKPSVFKVELSPLNTQKFCLSLLQYLPLEVLKKVSMSSGSLGLRQIDGKTMTLQFVQDTSAMSLLSPPWQGKINVEQYNEGLRFLLQEVLDGRNSIGAIIRIFSEDLGDDYLKLSALGELLYLLDQVLNKNMYVDYSRIINILTTAFPNNEGLLVKSNFLGDDIMHAFTTDADFLYDISTCTNEVSLPKVFVQVKTRLKRVQNAHHEIELLKRFSKHNCSNSYGKFILAEIFETLSWISMDKKLFSELLEILETHYQEDWNTEPSWYDLWITCIKHSVDVDLKFANVIRSKTIRSEILVFQYLNDSFNTPPNLTKSCFENTECLIDWLNAHSNVSEMLASHIFLYVNPTDVNIQKKGAKPWIWLLNYSGKQTLDYYAFVFSLSFNWKNDIAVKFLRTSFYSIHNILANDRDRASVLWSKVMEYGDTLPDCEDWDNCKKLRKGLVKNLKSRGFDKSVLKNLTPNKELNESIEKFW